MIQLLVVNGAQIDALDATGQSPLSVAFDNGDDETILCMLNGASTSSGESYALDVEHLITAVKSGRKDLIQLCLPFILDINMMNQVFPNSVTHKRTLSPGGQNGALHGSSRGKR